MKFLTLLFAVFFSLLPFFNEAQNVEESFGTSSFSGKIGTFAIQGELTNSNGQLIGWYDYPGKSTKLRLEGYLINENIELLEYNYKTEQTGFFKGKLSDNNNLKGEWRNPDGSKRLNFTLHLEAFIFTKEANIETSNSIQKEEQPKRKMFKPSKVKGFSKLALWTAILLILGILSVLVFLIRSRRKLKEKPKEIHTKEIIREYVNDSVTPEDLRHKQGELFQKCVVEMFLSKKEYFDWIDSTRDVKYGDLYPKSNMNPDLILRFKYEKFNWKEDIAVECKFRVGTKNDKVYIDDARKLSNYREFEKKNKIRTFLALGLGGVSTQPKTIFIIPINLVQSEMSLDELTPFLNNKPYFYYDYNKKTLS